MQRLTRRIARLPEIALRVLLGRDLLDLLFEGFGLLLRLLGGGAVIGVLRVDTRCVHHPIYADAAGEA